TERIRAWVDAAQEWPPLARSIAYKWLDEGLQPRAITRDLDWGVPVTKNGRPRPGFDNKVFYVWFDAPIEYIAATAEWANEAGRNGGGGGCGPKAPTTAPMFRLLERAKSRFPP